jgi:fructose-1,6-bisphosphatase
MISESTITLRKANVVADTLSHKSYVSQLVVNSMPFELCEEFIKLNLRIVANTEVVEMEVGSSLLQEIQKGQVEDEKIQEIKCNIEEEKLLGFLRMIKECCGTKEASVFLTSGS